MQFLPHINIKRMALCHPFLFVTLLFLSTQTYAQFEYNRLVTDAYRQVFINQKMSLNQLDKQVTSETKGTFTYLKGLKHTIDYLVYAKYDGVLDSLKQNNKVIKQLNCDSPFGQFFLGESYFHLGLIQVAQNNKVGALISLKKAYHIHLKNKGLPTDFYGDDKTLGTLEIIFNEAKNYSEFAGLVTGVKVGEQEGEHKLLQAVTHHSVYQFEARLFQVLLHQFVTHEEEKANQEIKKILSNNHSSNVVFSTAAVIYTKNNKSIEALSILKKVDKTNAYFTYLQGVNHLQLLQYEQARAYFDQFLKTNPSYYQTSALYYLAECFYLTDNKLLMETIEAVKEAKHQDLPADQSAKNKVDQLLNLNKQLLKVRLLFDGGEFQKSLSVLLTIDKSSLTKAQFIEYYYRLARNYQELQQFELAKSNFLLVVFKSDKHAVSYFAPYSCLQLGRIYFSEQNVSKAKHYISNGLSYKHYEHQASIKVQLNKVSAQINEEEISK